MRSYTCTSPWILTDFITLIKPTGGQFLVFKTVTAWNHWLSYMLSVLFIVCFYTQQMTQNSSIYLLWQFHGFEYQMKNLWIHFWWFSFQCFDFSWGIYCSSVSRGNLCTSWSSFLKNSADEVENAPKSLNSQGFHTTFIFGNFTDDIGNMRTLKTPTSPGTLNMSSYGTLDNTAAQPWKSECVTVASSAITQCCNHTHTFNTLKTEETS